MIVGLRLNLHPPLKGLIFNFCQIFFAFYTCPQQGSGEGYTEITMAVCLSLDTNLSGELL